MEKKKILLIEEKDYLIDLKMRLMKRADCEVVTASDGDMALELTLRERPDLVIMDATLRGVKGNCETITRNPSLRDIPVIIIISKDQEDEVKSCLKAGLDEYITKPLNKSELFKKLRAHLDVAAREHIRLPMSISASYTVNGAEFSCKVHDMSEGGMLILSDNPLSIKSSLLLKFVVPTSDVAILALGEVMRVVENIPLSTGRPTTGYGIKFLKMPSIGRQIISKAGESSTNHAAA